MSVPNHTLGTPPVKPPLSTASTALTDEDRNWCQVPLAATCQELDIFVARLTLNVLMIRSPEKKSGGRPPDWLRVGHMSAPQLKRMLRK